MLVASAACRCYMLLLLLLLLLLLQVGPAAARLLLLQAVLALMLQVLIFYFPNKNMIFSLFFVSDYAHSGRPSVDMAIFPTEILVNQEIRRRHSNSVPFYVGSRLSTNRLMDIVLRKSYLSPRS